jgi:8-oxo-dGTP pyrophosphatase MutT (NUDIX family)
MSRKWFIVNVEAAIYQENKWLIIKRSETEENAPGTLSLVGGKVELTGDNLSPLQDVLEETLIREIKEEVGIQIAEDIRYLESKFFISDTDENIIDIVFLAKYQEGIVCCNDKDEVGAVYWLTSEEVLEHKKSPDYLKETIKKAEELRRQEGGYHEKR